MITDQVIVYSIGHSDHAPEAFIRLLQQYHIATLVDVRSQPYSRWVPAYNRETLMRSLEAADMRYVFMGDLLGGRPPDATLYNQDEPKGRPDYERLAATPAFQSGLERLIGLARGTSLSMMCSEGDYHQCHRALLITPHLLARGVRVMHILPDGTTEEARPQPKQLALF